MAASLLVKHGNPILNFINWCSAVLKKQKKQLRFKSLFNFFMFIYKQYDQAALDRQYNNRLQVPEWADYLEKGERTSREAEKKYSSVKNIAYGEGSLETLDIF